MAKTPLHDFLSKDAKISASAFAGAHGFSEWSVRHWVRGNKIPSPDMQDRLSDATGGKVTPAAWAAFGQAKRMARAVAESAAA